VNTFEYSDLLLPLFIGAANLVSAGLLHRAIVRNSTLLSRRHFFESLAVLAFLIALTLVVAGFVLWRDNPRFVLVCSVLWISACAVAVLILQHANRRRADDELTLPEQWLTSAERSTEVRVESLDGPTGATRAGAVPLDAATRERLKKARRQRSASNERFRMNRSVYSVPSPGRCDRPERPER